MRFSLALGSLAFLSVLGVARANPQDASDQSRWAASVQTFAGALNGSRDRADLDKVVSAHSWVAPFARNRSESVTVLPERLAGMSMIGAHAYLQPGVSAASDLIADVKANTAIAVAVRTRIIPTDGRDPHAADATMARWFASTLEAEQGDPVALIALYDPGQATADGPAAPTIVLVIAKGEFRADGTPIINRVLYGTLDAAVK